MKTATADEKGWKQPLQQLFAGMLLLAVVVLSGPTGVAHSEEVPPSDDAIVQTGDAVADNTTSNTVNTSDTTVTDTPGSDGSDAQGTEGDDVCDDLDLPEGCEESLSAEDEGGDGEDLAITASTTNDADVANTSTTTAATGENTAGATGNGNALVDTGNALAAANVINVVNTNLFNSNGLIMLLNLLFGGTIDLREAFSMFGGDGSGSCSLESCDDENTKLSVVNNSDADVINDVVVRSGSGENAASADGGNASIGTGNAYAAANLVNILNSNFVDSNYLLLTVNSFGGMDNLILPGASFFEQLFGPSACCNGGNTTIANDNTADVGNAVEVGAESGNNEATGGDGSVITTGTAAAATNVFNQLNTNSVGGTRFFFLIRVHGDWIGDVFGAPEGISWNEGPNGIQLFNDPGEEGSASGSGYDSLDIANNNSAKLLNNVSVLALTGENKADSAGGTASVATGNAAAAANIINVVNTNVVGQNWVFAVFNIFGNWGGNIMFGQPDIQLFSEASNGNVQNGSCLDYTFTLRNRGDAAATNVMINPSPAQYLAWKTPGPWKVARVSAGGEQQLTRTACITGLPFGQTEIPLSVSAQGAEPDANMQSNSDQIAIIGSHADRATVGAPRPGIETIDPIWKITKDASATSTVPAGSSVTYTVVVQNDGGPAYNAILVDTLRGPNGKVVKTNKWNLQTVAANEEIRITYTIAFGAEMKPGVYTNEAYVEARGRSAAPQYSVTANSGIASDTVTLGPPLPPVVEAHELELSNVRVTALGGARDTAMIEWDTNIPATSQVVFGPSDDEYTFNVEDGTYYGYPEGTSQDMTKVTHHRVLLIGLTPGESYKYRAVSFASPGVGSDEYDFKLTMLSKPAPAAKGPVAMAEADEYAGPFAKANRAPLAIAGWDAPTNGESNAAKAEQVTMVPTSSLMNLAAVVGTVADSWFGAIAAALAGLFFVFLYVGRRKEEELAALKKKK